MGTHPFSQLIVQLRLWRGSIWLIDICSRIHPHTVSYITDFSLALDVDLCLLILSAEFRVGNWTSLPPSTKVPETVMSLVSDTRHETCAPLDLHDGNVLLRGQVTGEYKHLFVKITMATSVVFGPGPSQAICYPMSSSLLTHLDSGCGQSFCDVPTTCRYLYNKVISTDPTFWQYDFSCVCGQALCSELLLWFRPDTVDGPINLVGLCEVDVKPQWIVLYRLHSPAHKFTTVSRSYMYLLYMYLTWQWLLWM